MVKSKERKVLRVQRGRSTKSTKVEVPRPLRGRKRVFNLIYSTNWQCNEDLSSLPPELREATRRMSAQTPLCCELTNRSFMQLLARIARELGFEVKRWPVRGPETCMALTRAARDGHISDCSAMLLHAWHGSYDKECVPSWDFYPLLKALKERSVVLYPSPELDEVHSAKRYRSEFMAPTQFLTLTRKAHGWSANGHPVAAAVRQAVKELLREAELNGLTTENLMLKQGFSWGGAQVTRLRPFEVLEFLRKRVIPKIPPQAKALTILLQAKVDLVAELRWMVLEGQLRGRGWVTLPVPRVGRRANSGCYKNEVACRAALEKGHLDRLALEEAIRPKVEQVVQEATRDAGGQVPQYLRVDFLVDKQGRAWLGERESWGADLVRNQVNPLGRSSCRRFFVPRSRPVTGLASVTSDALPTANERCAKTDGSKVWLVFSLGESQNSARAKMLLGSS
ncbi:unnamed protein product [Durusdinium trenchii]|uniref:Uncharacterized protein n=1 Tax=Durusdinium trenchii TaxID=1381693 RepID=A0ABP0LJQ6_9DINO